MVTNSFGLVVVALSLLCLFVPLRFSIMLLFALTAFGTAAAITMPALGGGTILVANFFLVTFVLKAFAARGPDGLLRAALPPSPGVWLLALTVWATFSAIFLPRLLEGVTDTMTVMRLADGEGSVVLQPLRFSSGNINQLIYAIGGFVAFCASFATLSVPGAVRHFINAVIAVSVVNIALALFDIATFLSGTAYLMDFLRTAGYSMLTGAMLGGIKRITAGFSEASAFSGYTLILFSLTASLWLDKVRPMATGCLAGCLGVLLLLSTSTTAYVALAILAVLFALETAVSCWRGRRLRRPIGLAVVLIAVVASVAALVLFRPGAVDAVSAFLQEAVFSKAGTESAAVRGSWNQVAFGNFLDSGGLGVGVGSARASAYPLVLLSNVGVPGVLLFLGLYGTLLFGRPRLQDQARRTVAGREGLALLAATRYGMVGSLTGASIVATTYDLGLLHYVLAGAAASILCGNAQRAARNVGEPSRIAGPAAPPPGLGSPPFRPRQA